MSHSKSPIPDPLHWIFPINKTDYADSTVVGLVGPKRSGKSLIMARLAFEHMLAGRPVWSNIPIQTPSFFLDKGFPMLETMPVDWNAFFTMSEEYQDGLMCLDEASGVNSNRQWGSMRNRVMNAFTNQVGHRGLDILWTAKSASWLDRQGLGFETDIEIECMDLAKTTWGRINHVEKGTLIRMDAWDRSGALTGRAVDYRDKYARPFKVWFVNNCWHYWDGYDTRGLQTIEELFTGVKLNLKQRVISNKPSPDDDSVIRDVYDLVNKLRQDAKIIPCDTFRDVADSMGLGLNDKTLGQTLKRLGIKHVQKRGGNVYNLTDLKEIKGAITPEE